MLRKLWSCIEDLDLRKPTFNTDVKRCCLLIVPTVNLRARPFRLGLVFPINTVGANTIAKGEAEHLPFMYVLIEELRIKN